MAKPILPTNNSEWGFFGTLAIEDIDVEHAWQIASTLIGAKTASGAEGVRDFLDSRHGRHFADEVVNELGGARGDLRVAIQRAFDRWQGWRIDRRMSRETGIPEGLPYLAGLVAHFEILDEMRASE